jgi:HSP20 family protein
LRWRSLPDTRAPPNARAAGGFEAELNGAASRKEKTMNSVTKWDPFRKLRRREDVFEDFLSDFFGREDSVVEPPVEVAESDNDITVKMLVPGVEKDQLQVAIDEDVLTVRGEMRKEQEEKKKNYYRQEIHYGAFQRAVRLPAEVEGTKATADLKNGTLKITLPKSKQPKAQQIKVAVS